MAERDRAPELVVRVNGHQAAYMSYYGRDTLRDRYLRHDAYRQANTSCSVSLRDPTDGTILLHLLFDAGLGTVNSLEAARAGTGVAGIADALFLTHPHLDHYAALDRLAHGLRGAHELRGEKGWALPLYCTTPCAERVIGRSGAFPWLAVPDGPVRHHPVTPCVPVAFEVDGQAVLTVTPVSVYHGPFAPGAVIYVVETADRKVILAWDLLRLVEAPEQPSETERRMFVTALLPEHAGLVRDADVLFLDSCTWNPRPSQGHISIREGLALARAWRPRRLYWIHYSGSERPEPPVGPVVDLPGIRVDRPLTDPELQWLAGRVSGMLDMDVRAAYPGMVLPDTEPWPDDQPGTFP